jgi:hypothetical protein
LAYSSVDMDMVGKNTTNEVKDHMPDFLQSPWKEVCSPLGTESNLLLRTEESRSEQRLLQRAGGPVKGPRSGRRKLFTPLLLFCTGFTVSDGLEQGQAQSWFSWCYQAWFQRDLHRLRMGNRRAWFDMEVLCLSQYLS